MTEVGLMRLRFKDGGKEKWLRWCEELRRREGEAMETLEAEGMISEACFLSSDEKEVFYFLESPDLAKSSSHNFPIDLEHKAVRESSLERGEGLKVLFNFHRQQGNVARD